MPRKTVPRGTTRRPDPAGMAWRAEAAARWEKARGDIRRFTAPTLPTWTALEHVTRPLYGRYLIDRDTGIVHDVEHALASCRLDEIPNATFVHFVDELEGTDGHTTDCTCMREDQA